MPTSSITSLISEGVPDSESPTLPEADSLTAKNEKQLREATNTISPEITPLADVAKKGEGINSIAVDKTSEPKVLKEVQTTEQKTLEADKNEKEFITGIMEEHGPGR